MKWKEQLKGMAAYQPGKSEEEVKRTFGLTKIVKLASNENPYGSSTAVEEYLNRVDLKANIYPDGYAGKLREALSKKLNVRPGQLLFGDGADEIISIISRSLLRPGVNAIMSKPSFVQYRHNAKVEGAEFREIPVKEGAQDLEKMLLAIDGQTTVVWLCSPNNPTGTLLKTEDLIKFMERVPTDVLVVLDEAYVHYITEPDFNEPISLLDRFENLLLLRTFSKIYGLASFRVGYAIGQESVISMLDPVRSPFNVSSISLGVAEAALADDEFIEMCRTKNAAGREQFRSYCEKRNLHLFDSQANFMLMEVKADADTVFLQLMKRGFIVRSGTGLDAPNYIRVTVGTKEQNDEFFEKLDEVLKELGVLS
ncbi:histidinol-phosphate transaminase [Chungangia koreensis]|uniref:Histidinol-phosphate aminotransferase n=1 Tax=Chungangia koreensis TaxID=752657 RepID=A0ABV8X6N0_9LACT